MIIGAWTLHCDSSNTWCTKIVHNYIIILESSTWIYLTGVKYISRPVQDYLSELKGLHRMERKVVI